MKKIIIILIRIRIQYYCARLLGTIRKTFKDAIYIIIIILFSSAPTNRCFKRENSSSPEKIHNDILFCYSTVIIIYYYIERLLFLFFPDAFQNRRAAPDLFDRKTKLIEILKRKRNVKWYSGDGQTVRYDSIYSLSQVVLLLAVLSSRRRRCSIRTNQYEITRLLIILFYIDISLTMDDDNV